MVEAVTWSFISSRRPNCSAAARPSWRSPIRSPPTSPTCGRACCRAWSPLRRATPIAATPMSALFEVGQMFRGDRPQDQFVAASGVRHALRLVRRAWAGTGPARRRRMRCDAKADALRGAGGRRRADAGAADRARRRRPGCIRAVPAPSRSARRTCSAISASCIRARSKRSAPTARWSRSR